MKIILDNVLYGARSVARLNRLQIDEFVKKLLSIKELLPDKYKSEIDELVITLSNKLYDNITIAGD